MARKNAYRGQPGTNTALFTASGPVTITAATATDEGGSGDTLLFYVNTTATSTGRTIYNGLSVASGANSGLPLLVGQTLNNGETLYCTATAGSQVTVTISVEGSTT